MHSGIVRKRIGALSVVANIVLGLFFCIAVYFFDKSLIGAVATGLAFSCVAIAALHRLTITIHESSGFDQHEVDHGLSFVMISMINLFAFVLMDRAGWKSVSMLALIVICTVGGVMYFTWYYSIQCKRCSWRWVVFRWLNRRLNITCRHCKYSEPVANE